MRRAYARLSLLPLSMHCGAESWVTSSRETVTDRA